MTVEISKERLFGRMLWISFPRCLATTVPLLRIDATERSENTSQSLINSINKKNLIIHNFDTYYVTTYNVSPQISMLNSQSRGRRFKSKPVQKFLSRFQLHLCPISTQLYKCICCTQKLGRSREERKERPPNIRCGG